MKEITTLSHVIRILTESKFLDINSFVGEGKARVQKKVKPSPGCQFSLSIPSSSYLERITRFCHFYELIIALVFINQLLF